MRSRTRAFVIGEKRFAQVCSTCAKRGVLVVGDEVSEEEAKLTSQERDVRSVLRSLSKKLRSIGAVYGGVLGDGYDASADIVDAWASRPNVREGS